MVTTMLSVHPVVTIQRCLFLLLPQAIASGVFASNMVQALVSVLQVLYPLASGISLIFLSCFSHHRSSRFHEICCHTPAESCQYLLVALSQLWLPCLSSPWCVSPCCCFLWTFHLGLSWSSLGTSVYYSSVVVLNPFPLSRQWSLSPCLYSGSLMSLWNCLVLVTCVVVYSDWCWHPSSLAVY